MQRRCFPWPAASSRLAVLAGRPSAQQVPTLRVLTHSSFDLPAKELLAKFERKPA
jgi:hypothetical protein